MRATIFALLSGLAALAQASTAPTTQCTDSCNPIFTPALAQIVPAGQPFNITWKPTTTGTVTLVLLRGPSNNVQPLYSIADTIPNSGSFLWTPKTDLQADTTHYGLQLIEDSNGQFQYSVQFGISNSASPSGGSGSGSGTGSGSTSASASAGASATSGGAGASQTGASTVTPVSSAPVVSGSAAPTASASVAPTRVSTSVVTTRSVSSTHTVATPSASASNAASVQRVGGALGLVGALAVLAL